MNCDLLHEFHWKSMRVLKEDSKYVTNFMHFFFLLCYLEHEFMTK